jgi:hypothetical protein
VGAAQDFDGHQATLQPLLWVLLAVVLGDANRLELSRVLMMGDPPSERWEAVTVIEVVESPTTLLAS